MSQRAAKALDHRGHYLARRCNGLRVRQIGCVVIREPSTADYAQWLVLWEQYNAFYGREGPTALAPSITETTWRRFFDPDEPVHALVADLNGRLTGFAHFVFHRSTIAIAPTCYLQDLFTSEDARGRGVATNLIETVATIASALGSARLYWQTHETNDPARALYDRIAQRSGFIVYRKPLEPS